MKRKKIKKYIIDYYEFIHGRDWNTIEMHIDDLTNLIYDVIDDKGEYIDPKTIKK